MDIFLQQMINGLVLGSMYALVALGYTMVYGIVNLIMIGFTVAVLIIGPWTGLKIAVAAAYGLMEGIEVLGFVAPLVHSRFRYDPSETV